MARRRQMRIDPSVFLQQQGGNDEASQLAMAMEMLGFGKGQEGTRGQLALGREQLAAETGVESSKQKLEERKLAETERAALAQEAFNNWVKEQTLLGQDEERKFKTAQLAGKAQESKDALNAKILEFETEPEIRRALYAEMSPDAQRMQTRMDALKQNKVAGDILRNVETAYGTGDPKQIKTAIAGVSPEILQRPEFEWEKWNQGMPGPQLGILDRLRNLVGGGGERERAAAEAAKVAPPPEAGPAIPRPMAFTGYEPPAEGPARRGYGAVPGGDVGPALPELLAKALGPAAPPSSGRGYYTPQAPVEAPIGFEYMAGGPSAMPPRVSVNDLLSKLMAPGTSVMAPY